MQLSLLMGAGYGSQAGLTNEVVKHKFACPAHLLQMTNDGEVGASSKISQSTPCPIQYNHVYDVQRHLRSEHNLVLECDALKGLFEAS
ncbi:hypothetical protein CROQUDRAFT_663810 [Cronartium quercuum f. sp. fusiforme G11]|uniref:Uncharacterized protein n=1 Tax=Cronartium quercuum f. sp. fusiforme G11 TaxID=708437 RepID=A0A9P6T8G7_9BASI|nr:hypothetical protein CROQUDRAFT_663810 [Cronartium quercuum f. sp. fusiforme G11]